MHGGNRHSVSSGKTGYANMTKSTSVFTQTEQPNQLNLLKLLLFSQNLVLNEDSKNFYYLTMDYINSFHHLLNEKLALHLMEKGIYDTFKIPNIPNYIFLYDIFFQTDSQIHTHQNEEIDNNEAPIKRKEMQIQKNLSREKTQISHKVVGKKLELECNKNRQYSHLKFYENDITEKMKEIISSDNSPKILKKIDNGNESDNKNKRGDKCFILSKYHDEGKNKTFFNI